MLSIITKKSPGFESHDFMQPTVGLNLVASDLALVNRMSLYAGLGSIRFALPKLQNIINPRSCVPVLFFSFSNVVKMRFASFNSCLSFVCSYKYRREPG